MLNNLLSVVWNIDPVAFSIGPLSVRWYGILWAIGIYLCYLIQVKLYRHEGYPDEWTDSLFMYIVIGTIIGARLGHCLFYEWHEASRLGLQPIHFLGMTFTYRNPYIEHPLELFKIWQGGLASHGGAIGIITASWLLGRKRFQRSLVWVLDRLVVGVAVTAFFIRLGNLMNSEIYGGPTSLPWGFVFVRDGQTVPCHPTQIYEMLYCVVAFIACWLIYWKAEGWKREGLLIGVFLEIVFFTRFCLEFIKFNQEAFEANFLLNMGQILSIPFILWGAYLIYTSLTRPIKEYPMPKLPKDLKDKKK